VKTVNEKLNMIIEELKQKNDKISLEVAKHLSKSAKQRIEVNLSKIERLAKDGELIVVPGKVIGDTKLTKKITLACFKISETANEIVSENGKILSIEEWMKQDKKGRLII